MAEGRRRGEERGRRRLVARHRGLIALSTRESHRVLKLWTQTVVAPILSSFLFILVFGLSLGSRIKQIDGVDYEVFIVPGLIAMAMIQATYANNSASVFQARFDRYLNDVLAAPMRPWEVNLALSIGGVVRALLIGAGLLACAMAVVDVPVRHPFELVLAVTLALVLFSSFGVIVGVYANSWDHTAFVTNIVILPLTFLGGVFYSVDRLPAPWHEISHANPDLLPAQRGALRLPGHERRELRARAGGDRRARGGHGGVELMAVSDRAPAQALRTSGIPLVLVAITSLQFGAAIAGTIFDEIGAAGTSLLRSLFAAAILLAVWRPSLRGRSARDLRLIALFGLVLGAMNLCIYESFARIPLGIAVTIEFAGPLGIAVALSRRRLDLAAAALAAVGIVLLADPGGGAVDALGVMFALVAAACWAVYILVAQAASRTWSGGRGLAVAMGVAVLVPLVPGIAGAGAELLDPRWLAIGCAVALMSSVLPYSLETEALRRLPANVFGVLMSVEPAVAAIAGWVILDQGLGARDIVAIGLVTAASIVVVRAAPPPAEA